MFSGSKAGRSRLRRSGKYGVVDLGRALSTLEDSSTPLGQSSRGHDTPSKLLDDPQRADADLQRSIVHARLFGGDDAPRIGRYRVVDTIGEGGMGTVYKGLDEKLDRHVALKRLKTVEATASQRERIIREARALGKLAHPNIVAIFEIAEHEDALFFAMEYVPGPTLREWARDHEPAWREVVEHYLQAGRALAAAHAAGLVHRDFKPQNAIVGDDGRVRVLDFGLVSAAGHIDEQTSTAPVGEGDLTETGAVLGTPAYIAPEQLRPGRVDHRADQFSFCVSLYEALYGERPFAALPGLDPVAGIRQGHTNGPRRLRATLERGIALKPENRFETMEALLQALQNVLRHRTRILVASGAVLVGGLGIAAANAAQPRWCEEDVSPGRTWDAARRAEVEAAVVAPALSPTSTARTYALERLDEWAAEWSRAHKEACLDTFVRGAQSTARLDEQRDCLEAQRRRVQGLTQVLVERGPAARDALDGIPTPAGCASATEAELAATVALEREGEVVQRLAEARANLAAGDRKTARLQLNGLQDRVDASGSELLQLEVRRLLVELEVSSSGVAENLAEWRALARDAQRARFDSLEADILTGLAEHAIGNLGREDVERALLDDLVAALDRAGRPDDDRYDVVFVLDCRALWNYGRAHEAVEKLDKRLVRVHSPPLRLRLSAELGSALQASGNLARAAVVFEETAELASALLGTGSPQHVRLVVNLAIVQTELGEGKRAAESFRMARGMYESLQTPSPLPLARLSLSEASLAVSQGEFERAARLLDDVTTAFERLLGDRSVELAAAHDARGVVGYYMGDHRAALRSYRKALQIYRATLGDTAPEVATLRSNIGESQLQTGQLSRALENFEDALPILRTSDQGPYLLAALKGYGLALLLSRQRDAAIEAFEEGLELSRGSRRSLEAAGLQLGLAFALRKTDPKRARTLEASAEATYSELAAEDELGSIRKLLEPVTRPDFARDPTGVKPGSTFEP